MTFNNLTYFREYDMNPSQAINLVGTGWVVEF